MTTQITIDDILAESTTTQTASKRLVKNHMTTYEWNILNHLKGNHVSRKNVISASKLSDMFNTDARQLRTHIRRIREFQNVIISSCQDGYYIPTEDEQKEANRTLLNHTLSQMDTVINNNPKLIGIFYKRLNEKLKTLDTATQNQIVMQFNGWERETVNYFGDKYITKKENK
jgi:hypothetical protein